jgi:hypothetical protein
MACARSRVRTDTSIESVAESASRRAVKPRTARRLAAAAGLLGAFALAVANLWYPTVRLASPSLNWAAMAVAALLPIAALGLALLVPGLRWRLAAAVLLGPVAALTLLSSTCYAVFSSPTRRAAAVSVGDDWVVAYEDPGPAFGPWSVAVRRERALLPGVLRVKPLYFRTSRARPQLKVVPGGIQLTVQRTSGDVGRLDTVLLPVVP